MWVYDLGTFEFLDVNEAVIKKYGYSKGLKMTIKRYGRRLSSFFEEGVYSLISIEIT
jgi:protein associated with RNAse G/E